jgi:hypothetical protein
MKSTPSDDRLPEHSHVWERRYRNGQTGWDRGQPSPALHRWLQSGALKPGRVLVPGCGHGHEIVDLIRSGCRVTAVDLAPTPVRRLRETLQAVYEQTCLCALEPGSWQSYGDRLWRWLEPGGRLFALFMQTGREGGPPYHCAMDRMEALFSTDRWQWLDEQALRVEHRNGLFELGYRLRRLP